MKPLFQEIYFETYGCTANKNSTEIMKGLVKQAGLNITSNKDFADLIVINSCIVKQPTEEKIRREIQDMLKEDKKIILAGCMPKFLPSDLKHSNNLFLLDTHHVKNIINLLQDIQTNQYDYEKYLRPRNEQKINSPKVSESKQIGITQISEGCLGDCTYCIVRLAKGKLFSYEKEKILDSIKQDLEAGCKEIHLTSQDLANYGNESGNYVLSELLKEILKLKHKFKIRLGMMNPNNVLPILKELIEIYKDEKVFKFLHLPIQSGSDRILGAMHRRYTREDVLKIINIFRTEFPDITISTDIIVGYPDETDEDFQETISLIKEIKPTILNRSNFYPRPKTKAASLKQISPEIMNKRSNELMQLHLQICKEEQKDFLNTEHKVLVDAIGFPGTYLARDENYKLYAIPSREKLLGKIINVRINKVTPHYLIASPAEKT